MPAEKLDRRIQRTQQLLGDALIALSVEKGYEDVTIRDITERANVAYITFFRHYENKHELLVHKVEEIVAELESAAHRSVPDDTQAYHETEGQIIFEHVQRHPDFYGLIGYSSARKQVQNALAKTIQSHLKKHTTTIPGDLAAHHSAVSLMGLIEWWLDNNMPYSPERMAQIYYQIIVKPILAG